MQESTVINIKLDSPILIWGAGAMGATLGACLLEQGIPVVFVDNNVAHVKALQETGLQITGPLKQLQVKAPTFTPETLTGSYKIVFLATKALHTEPAMLQLQPFLHSEGYVVSLQNGLNEHVIAAHIGAKRTMGCFVNFGADYIAPGHIEWGGRASICVGELDGSMTPRLQLVHQLLCYVEPNALMTPNIWGYLWGKLVYGALLFATAITNYTIYEVFEAQKYRPILIALAREVMRVAAAEGITLEAFDGFDPNAFNDAQPDSAGRSLEQLALHNRKSTKLRTGVWRDLAIHHRKTEIDQQLLPIIEIANRHGIATPHLKNLIDMVHAIETGHRTLESHCLDELASKV